ncbi:STAS domain-containing protein [Actinomadura miaoliensis]|uniref:STAS domain-containing protein n=1 Tax=Actinomadura miaoliensis TaxID=430685 RepID=A0ABP7WNP5_9ACTN
MTERPRQEPPATAPRIDGRARRAPGLTLRPLATGTGLRVEGEVNVANRAYWASELGGLVRRGGTVDLDLAGLVFIDAGGVAVLVRSAGRLRDDCGRAAG